MLDNDLLFAVDRLEFLSAIPDLLVSFWIPVLVLLADVFSQSHPRALVERIVIAGHECIQVEIFKKLGFVPPRFLIKNITDQRFLSKGITLPE